MNALILYDSCMNYYQTLYELGARQMPLSIISALRDRDEELCDEVGAKR
jgi:hypothetical protein